MVDGDDGRRCAGATSARERFALLLLDFHLPGEVDGLRFHEHLRQLGHDVPVIIVTGRSDEGTAIRALARRRPRLRHQERRRTSSTCRRRSRASSRRCRPSERLAESEARLATLIASAEDAFLVAEDDARITMINPAAARAFGIGQQEAIGRSLADFCAWRADADGLRARAGGAREPTARGFPVEGTVSRGAGSPIASSSS